MPTRYPNGITTAPKESTLGEFILLDPTDAHVYFDDFDTYAAGDWTITTTETGDGSATEVIGDDLDGGCLVITNAAGDNDLDFLQLQESFLMETGKKAWFKARFKIDEVIQCDFRIGLMTNDTTLLDVTDGIFFGTDDGDALLDFAVEKDDTQTLVTSVATLVADTFIVVGFYYNGIDAVEYYVNETKVGTAAVTNLPDDETLSVSFGLQNGEAAAKVLTVDYIFAAKER